MQLKEQIDKDIVDSKDDYTNNLDESFFGRWTYVNSSQSFYLTNKTNIEDKKIFMINKNQIKIEQDEKVLYAIRSGREDVKISGEIAVVNDPSTKKSPARAFSLKKIIVKLKHKATNKVKKYVAKVSEDDNKTGKIKDGVIYLKKLKNGNLQIPKNSELTMPTGEVELSLEDENNNNVKIDLDTTGESVDVGVVTLTDLPYNFKSYLEDDCTFIDDPEEFEMCNYKNFNSDNFDNSDKSDNEKTINNSSTQKYYFNPNYAIEKN